MSVPAEKIHHTLTTCHNKSLWWSKVNVCLFTSLHRSLYLNRQGTLLCIPVSMAKGLGDLYHSESNQWLLQASIGMQCTSIHSKMYPMHWHVLWHVLVECIKYIPLIPVYPILTGMYWICIVCVLCTFWIIICANTDLIHTTIHTTIRAQYGGNVCITIASTYQHVLICMVLVLHTYWIIIQANTD